jgi:hypothetical protein
LEDAIFLERGSKEVAYVECIEEETRFGLAIKVGRAAFVLSSFVIVAGRLELHSRAVQPYNTRTR